MIAVPLATFCIVLLLLCIVLLCAAIGRLLRTPPTHPDRGARRDTVLLLIVLSSAMALALIRTQFMSTTRLFLALSVALVPLGLMAFWLMVRLIGVYRREKERPVDSTLPDIETLQSRISPPFDGTKQ
ncbi:MAG: hypothetical protein JWL77_6637 [Chthonomonadaceae bacterium]|nr:hypothetical protein [Chthonomonadaceae bacterium]